MGGEIHVKSELGKGSAFTCTWPKKEIKKPVAIPQKSEAMAMPALEELPTSPEVVKSEETATAITTENGNSPEEKYTILVVEDHDDMRGFIVDTLKNHYQIQTASDGEQALALLKEKKDLPDLILSDVMMPRMDGFTLLEKVKSHPEWHTIPMVLLTARAAQEDKLQALTTGVDDYLTKPFDTKELLARIRNLLANYSEREKWQQKPQSSGTKAALDITFEEKPEDWGKEWLQQAEDIVKREMDNFKYKVTDLAAEMSISESQLLKKMKQLTGLTPNQFIREIKLQKARLLLESKAKSTIAEIAYAVGFDTPGYFTTVYEKRFGKRPGEYLS